MRGCPSASIYALLILTCAFTSSAAVGQAYPTRPVRIIAAQAGGQSDFVARQISPHVSAALGQPLVIDNRGGNAQIAIGAAAKSPPDGYTLLAYGSSLWTLPMLQKVNYDPFKDFAPVTLLSRSPNILVVHPSLPVKSVQDLITLAKARPGQLNYASTIVGSATHLAAELFKTMAGANIVRVPYKGAGAALNDLIGGHIEVMFSAPGSIRGHIQAGRLRGLAVTSKQRSPVMPGFRTIAESGLPGYESESMIALFAPAGTPKATVNRLTEVCVEVLQRTDIRDTLLKAGLEAAGTSADGLTTIMQAETVRLGKLIKAAGITPD